MALQTLSHAGHAYDPAMASVPQEPSSSKAAAKHPADATKPSGKSAGDNAQKSRRSTGDGGMRARIRKVFNTKAVPHEPALRFEGDWKGEVAEQVCQHWVLSQAIHNNHSVSLVALSRMKALEYERKHQKSIPKKDRLLPGSASKQDYQEAQIEAFLNAIGISGEEQTELMASFKLAGTGGLHRQHVASAATINGLIGATGQFLAAQHPAAAAALYGVRLLLQGVVAERILDSGWQRLRNAGTEDVLPLGRADAAPRAKEAPTLFLASHDVIWDLNGVKKNLRKMEAALKALDDTNTAYSTSRTEENANKVDDARKKLHMAFARICYQMDKKAAYKAASESAKIEFRGNQRYLAASYTGTGLTLGAGLFSILTPVLGIAAAPATGGVSAGAAVLAMLVYLTYQLSAGPSKDGEDKAKRAIVALVKLLVVLTGDTTASQEKRAAAYKTYLADRKKARLKIGNARTEARKAAKTSLITQLDKIAQEDEVHEGLMDSKQNWEAYREHLNQVKSIEATSEGEQSRDEIDAQIAALERKFEDDHEADFSTQGIVGAWKTPMRVRMDTASRLLKGKVAQSHKRLINLTQHPVLRARFSKSYNDRVIGEARTELRNNLRSLFNFELTLHHMQPLIENSIDGTDVDPRLLALAAGALGTIEDTDVHSIFRGNGREQVEVANKAKLLTAGEAERYVLPNIGASAAGIGLNAAVAATDFGLGLAKATHAVHSGLNDPDPEHKPRVPEFADYKFAGTYQAGAPVTAHMNAGDRAAFQKTQMPEVLEATKQEKSKLVERSVSFHSDISHLEDNDTVNRTLDALVAQLESDTSVPERLTLSMTAPDSNVPGHVDIRIDLQPTSAYHRARYQLASQKERLKVKVAKTKIVGRHTLMALGGFPAQAVAQVNLERTRNPLQRAAGLEKQVRRALQPNALADDGLENDEAGVLQVSE